MIQNRGLRRLVATGVTAVALTGAGIAAADIASAAGKNGVTESGEFGLYYSPNRGGPVFDLYVSDANFSGDKFPGTNTNANDNTASYWNRDSLTWWVYTDANAGGIEGSLPPGHIGNASATFRNEISAAYYYKAR